ncbi:DUF2723 domain-containing protein [bacterium]|nr:MAG: DUF2723 domain-containing protein [bacterium]
MFNYVKVNRITGLVVFVLSLFGYLATVSPTLSYWDCGEFAACAYSLAVPHPPGSPLFLLVGRLFSMLPTSEIGHAVGIAVTDYDIGFRVNMISVLCSAFAVLFLYLTIVRLLLQWKERPTDTFGALKITLSAAIAALTFAFTYSHWFNAVEAEVYAASTFSTAIVVWLIMVWLEKPDDIHSDVYLLLIAYMVGLAIGVHLLNILALPFIFFIIYSKKFEITVSSFIKFVIVGLIAMAVIYKVFIFWSIQVPLFFDQFGLAGASILLFFGILIYLSYYMIKQNNHAGALVVIASLLIFVGYSTYAMIMIRSGMNPNIDQNDPGNWAAFIRYMNREQYGDFSYWPRVAPFWDYQFNKMFVRYFNWQFIGRPDDLALSFVDHVRNAIGWSVDKLQDTQEDRYGYVYTVFSMRGLYGIPFIVGIIGAVHHFSRDWKRALAVFGLFITTGFAIIIYLNQPDPQPRERDYSYVGAFFSFSVWIGIGVYSILESIEEKLKNKNFMPTLVYTACCGLIILLPLNMFLYNKNTTSRQGNYVAWDYSYNLLETCEPNALIFTNGDNDTFPLWYLQEVEKVRPDVRIVNLSLLNTEWYIHQLKNQELEYRMKDGSTVKAMKVPIGYTDRQILGDPKIPNSSIQPTRWKSREFTIDVPKEIYWKDWVESGKALPKNHDTLVIPKMKFKVDPTISGQGLRVQDLMVLDILFASKFSRPIYYAITVSDDNKVGLGRYLRMDGLAYKLITVPDQDMSIDLMYENTFKKYKYRNMNNPDVSYDDNIRRLTQNYRTLFLRMVEYYRQRKMMGTAENLKNKIDLEFPESLTADQKIVAILDSMQSIITEEAVPMRDYRLKLAIGQFYADAGQPEKLKEYIAEVLANEKLYRIDQNGKIRIAALHLFVLKDAATAVDILKPIYESNPANPEALGYYIQALEESGNLTETALILESWLARNPQDVTAKTKLAEIKARLDSKK